MARNLITVKIVPFVLDGDAYMLREGLTWGDLCDLADEALDISAAGDRPRLRAGAMQLVQMRAGIKSWSGPGWLEEDGTTTPVTLEAIRALDPQIARQLLARIRELNPTVVQDALGTPAESKNPASAGPATSAAAADA